MFQMLLCILKAIPMSVVSVNGFKGAGNGVGVQPLSPSRIGQTRGTSGELRVMVSPDSWGEWRVTYSTACWYWEPFMTTIFISIDDSGANTPVATFTAEHSQPLFCFWLDGGTG